MGIVIEFNPDLALRSYGSKGRHPEECLPKKIERGGIYKFLKQGQRNYWLEGAIPLCTTEGNGRLSRPLAAISILEAKHTKHEDQKHDAPPHPEGLPFEQIRLRRSGVWQRRSCHQKPRVSDCRREQQFSRFGCSGSDRTFKGAVSVSPRHGKIWTTGLYGVHALFDLSNLKIHFEGMEWIR